MYEEFGAILLLVLAVTNRYELATSEIGITSTSSFIRQLLELEATEESIDDLDESKRKYLGDWIAALFVADSLSDEMTSSCSPHEFYRLVPTLLHQSLEACAGGKLSIENLKSGFDCELAYRLGCSLSITKLHRPTGTFPPSIARCGPAMACHSSVANDHRDQNLFISDSVTHKATIINRGTRDTSDSSLTDS